MKKYNYIDSEKICLFASEISIITGHNKFKNLGEIIFRIWKLNFNKDFLKYQNIYEKNKEIFKNDKEKLSDFIEKYNIDENIEKKLNVNNINNLKLEKDKIKNKCQEIIKDEKEKDKFNEILDNFSKTNFGNNMENNSIHIFTQLTNEPVISYKKFTKQIIFNYDKYKWYIGGRVDGLLKDKSIIEVKNRIHKLFRNLRDYEKIQIYCYMFIFNTKKSYLVETFFKNTQPETNIIEINYNVDYWNFILIKIEKFIDYFHKFLESDKLKINLLEKGPNNFKINFNN